MPTEGPRLDASLAQRIVATLDADLDDRIAAAFDRATQGALRASPADPRLYDLLRFHLGYVNAEFLPERSDPGKRVRAKVCVYSALAAGGDVDLAASVAAAIELLHNFTLIHDDIQDRSLLRRSRPTLWSRWGEAQAINAGDAMFVLAHLALNGLVDQSVDPAVVLALSTELHRTTLRIVEGQVLDLGYERRDDVTSDEYLTMIGGKTAAICRFAAWAGAIVAGSPPARAARFAEFGEAFGLGFQLRDDVLGVWGATEATGKDASDIRRRKKSYPVLLLFERAEGRDRARLADLYSREELDDEAVAEVVAMLDRYGIRQASAAEAMRRHADALAALDAAQPRPPGDALLRELLTQLAERKR